MKAVVESIGKVGSRVRVGEHEMSFDLRGSAVFWGGSRPPRSVTECAEVLIEEARVVFVHLSIEEREGVAPVVRK